MSANVADHPDRSIAGAVISARSSIAAAHQLGQLGRPGRSPIRVRTRAHLLQGWRWTWMSTTPLGDRQPGGNHLRPSTAPAAFQDLPLLLSRSKAEAKRSPS